MNRLNTWVYKCALVLDMDGRRTGGKEDGPTQAFGSPFLDVAVPKGSGDIWDKVCPFMMAMSELLILFKALC